MDDIKELIRAYIAKKANLHKLGEEDKIIEMNYLDSMGFVEFSLWLERQFNITVSDSDFSEENFHDLRAITEFVKRKEVK
jgi:acyl carrier protein